jgi:hypothetical protein
MASSFRSAQFLIESRVNDAANGDADALFELGIAYSSGTGGVEVNLIEAINGSILPHWPAMIVAMNVALKFLKT